MIKLPLIFKLPLLKLILLLLKLLRFTLLN
jgi:hypothetical protein